jgi:5-methylcytosine-specific restriction endonuclease McrA
MENLKQLPSHALTARLYQLRKQERGLLVEFLAYLAELDRRQLYLELGFSSTFAFLTDHLGYTKSAAFRRTTAARLVARFPVVLAHLGDGRLGLTTLVELRDVLTEVRLGEILDRAAGRTEEQVRELAATLRPSPAPMDLLRRLPQPKPAAPADVPVSSGPEQRLELTSAPGPAPRIHPISEDLRVLRVTVGRDFVADLESARAALSHQIPDGNIVKVLHECVRRTLLECHRRRQGAGRRRTKARKSEAAGRYVPAEVRAEVWRRDEARCTFVGTSGHRCGSTHQLHLHHICPFAKGGESTVSNLTVMCSRHNRFLAEQDYGADHMARAVAEKRSTT